MCGRQPQTKRTTCSTMLRPGKCWDGASTTAIGYPITETSVLRTEARVRWAVASVNSCHDANTARTKIGDMLTPKVNARVLVHGILQRKCDCSNRAGRRRVR